MSIRNPDTAFWRNRQVLITGHTGFKGSWLARWLAMMGAAVHGVALAPPTRPSMFESARVAAVLRSDRRVDIRDSAAVRAAVAQIRPTVIFHMAAQPLVRDGYRRPSDTFATNAMGTVNLLEAARSTPGIQGIVIVTTDKVYLPESVASAHNEAGVPGSRARTDAHREEDRLGGTDPYSISKVMAELVVEGYRALPAMGGSPGWTIPLATARAGNVIGGGDWSPERLVPDAIRAFSAGERLQLRFPNAVRPWQHVLEPLSGYLLLAETIVIRPEDRSSRAFNFGPEPDGDCSVSDLARSLAEHWGTEATIEDSTDFTSPYENPVLRLDSTLARRSLEWAPRWGLDRTVEATVDWYRSVADGSDPGRATDCQIADYLVTMRL